MLYVDVDVKMVWVHLSTLLLCMLLLCCMQTFNFEAIERKSNSSLHLLYFGGCGQNQVRSEMTAWVHSASASTCYRSSLVGIHTSRWTRSHSPLQTDLQGAMHVSELICNWFGRTDSWERSSAKETFFTKESVAGSGHPTTHFTPSPGGSPTTCKGQPALPNPLD